MNYILIILSICLLGLGGWLSVVAYRGANDVDDVEEDDERRLCLELLVLLRQKVVDDQIFKGMCITLEDLDGRTLHEMHILRAYLRDNKPEHAECGMIDWWWPVSLKEPRLDWLDEHIKKLKSSPEL